jgi:hypothetical protein
MQSADLHRHYIPRALLLFAVGSDPRGAFVLPASVPLTIQAQGRFRVAAALRSADGVSRKATIECAGMFVLSACHRGLPNRRLRDERDFGKPVGANRF